MHLRPKTFLNVLQHPLKSVECFQVAFVKGMSKPAASLLSIFPLWCYLVEHLLLGPTELWPLATYRVTGVVGNGQGFTVELSGFKPLPWPFSTTDALHPCACICPRKDRRAVSPLRMDWPSLHSLMHNHTLGLHGFVKSYLVC